MKWAPRNSEPRYIVKRYVKPRTAVPWQSILAFVSAVGAVANPLDLIPAIAVLDDVFIAPALIVVGILYYRKAKERGRLESANDIDAHVVR